MKALSLWQPWASAIAVGAKMIETRGWWTPHRGPLAIHAAKKWDADLAEFWGRPLCDSLREAGLKLAIDLPFGAIVATCRLKECLRTADIADLTRQERAWGDFSPGRYGWLLTDIVRLEKPIPFRGAQQLFDCPIIGESGEGERR